MVEIELANLARTMAFGRRLGQLAGPGDVITLAGEPGAGKTTLAQAIGQGLAVPAQYYITSPTFALLHEYPGRIPYYHMDFYRLAGEEDIEALGFEDYFYGDGLTVVEWPDRLGSLTPAARLHIELASPAPDRRLALVTAYGMVWRARLAEIAKSCLINGG